MKDVDSEMHTFELQDRFSTVASLVRIAMNMAAPLRACSVDMPQLSVLSGSFGRVPSGTHLRVSRADVLDVGILDRRREHF